MTLMRLFGWGALVTLGGCDLTPDGTIFGAAGSGGDTWGNGGTGGAGGAQASSSSGNGGGSSSSSSTSSSSSSSGSGGGSSSSTSSSSSSSTSSSSSSSGNPGCEGDPNVDNDGDGASETQGDCNDCDKRIGPGSIEVPTETMGQPTDEDCDGFVDNVLATCDNNLILDDVDPQNGARAVDLCQFVTPTALKWGVHDAKYVRANGVMANPGQQVGLQSGFGPNVNPQKGTRLLALSSGRARIPNQTGACGTSNCDGLGAGTAPTGFPQNVPNCPPVTKIFDDVGLELKLRAPANASGYQFDFRFYSFEYPEWVCKEYNDQFISLVLPSPAGSINGNISFDTESKPISVNVGFIDVCTGCAAGISGLEGTGFNTWNDAGGTSWLRSQAPIQGRQEFTIRWTLWDGGDANFDSTTLVDNFQWITNGSTVTVKTGFVQNP